MFTTQQRLLDLDDRSLQWGDSAWLQRSFHRTELERFDGDRSHLLPRLLAKQLIDELLAADHKYRVRRRPFSEMMIERELGSPPRLCYDPPSNDIEQAVFVSLSCDRHRGAASVAIDWRALSGVPCAL